MYEQYLGKRVKRGLFKSQSCKPYSVDLNSSRNMLRKVIGESMFDRKLVDPFVFKSARCKRYQSRNI